MTGTRDGAIARAEKYFDEGGFLEELQRRVAIPTTSQEADSMPALQEYVSGEMTASLTKLGYECTVLPNPRSAATRRRIGANNSNTAINLIGNALRHGAAEVPVTVRVQGAPGHATLEVHNGGTIDAEVLPYLFDPFQSRKDRTARAEGLGLGLYIVHQLVLAHGGTIEVTSTATDGTTFRIQLPRDPTPADPPPG